MLFVFAFYLEYKIFNFCSIIMKNNHIFVDNIFSFKNMNKIVRL
jgi:hypothetical protein